MVLTALNRGQAVPTVTAFSEKIRFRQIGLTFLNIKIHCHQLFSKEPLPFHWIGLPSFFFYCQFRQSSILTRVEIAAHWVGSEGFVGKKLHLGSNFDGSSITYRCGGALDNTTLTCALACLVAGLYSVIRRPIHGVTFLIIEPFEVRHCPFPSGF